MFTVANSNVNLVSTDTLARDIVEFYKACLLYIAKYLQRYPEQLHYRFNGRTDPDWGAQPIVRLGLQEGKAVVKELKMKDGTVLLMVETNRNHQKELVSCVVT